jgi:hypothetical protein
MNYPKKTSQHIPPSPGANDKGDEPSLLVLALLEQLHIDRAHGRYYDLAYYYAANPGLEEEFLALALAALRDNEGTGSASSLRVQEDNSSGRRPLSPGVLRALGRISEFSSDVTGSEQRRVAEYRAPYAADEEQ